VLRATERAVMQEFSRRTVEHLSRHPLFALLLPAFRPFLAANVRKEIDKDLHVISAAAIVAREGHEPASADVTRLLHEARVIDQAFVHEISRLPINLTISYPDVEPTRRRRIECLLALSHRLLVHWHSTPRLRRAIALAYSREQFHAAVDEILHLYALETRQLNRSLHLPALVGLARDQLAETVYSEMETVARGLAGELTDKAFRRRH